MTRGERFKELRKKLREIGIIPTSEYLAELIGISVNALKNRLCGRADWGCREMYQIMRIINEPLHMVSFYFPPEDVSKREAV